jgi:uncharacterized protein
VCAPTSSRRRLPQRRAGSPAARLDWSRSYDTRVRLVAIGLAAGVFSAFFGVGGGIVAVPLLILTVGLPERVATATSLLAIAITASAGVIVFAFRGEVNPGYAALVGLPAAVGVLAGTAWQQRVRTSTLAYGFAVVLCAIGIWLVAS